MYTLYTGELTELPIDKISGIVGGAKFVVHRREGRIDSCEYSWPDLTVRLTVMPNHELQDHLRGFQGYIAAGCKNLGIAPPKGLFERIAQVKLVLGFIATPDMDPAGRAENILGAIAYNSKSLIFHGGSVYNEDSDRLFPPAGNPDAVDLASN